MIPIVNAPPTARVNYIPNSVQATRPDKYSQWLDYGIPTVLQDQSNIGPVVCNLINPASQLRANVYNTPVAAWGYGPISRTSTIIEGGNLQYAGSPGNMSRVSGEKIRQFLLGVQAFWASHNAYPTVGQ